MKSLRKRVVHIVSSLKVGGAEIFLLNLIESLDQYEHIVFYIHDGPIRNKLQNLGIKVIRFTIFSLKDIHSADLVHSSLWLANFISVILKLLLKFKLVASLHSRALHEGKLRNFFSKYFLKIPDKVIAVSENIKFDFINLSKNPNIICIENGINIDYITNLKPKFQKNNCFVIGAVGRLCKVKNFDLLIKVFNSLFMNFNKNICLVIVGNGPEFNNLNNLVKLLNLENNVFLVGEQNALDYYSVFDCFVQISHSEGFSLALLEAMTFKVPVIVSQSELIESGVSGFIVSANNFHEIETRLIEIISDKNIRDKFSDNAFLKVSGYDFSITADKYKNVYDNL